jgi:hypothetical protein
MENFVIVGDIHGEWLLLRALLDQIEKGPYRDHKLLFVGDMNDRGPETYTVISTIKRLCEENRAIALLGNHEDMMLEWVDYAPGDPTHYWLLRGNGGLKTIRSYMNATGQYGLGYFPEILQGTGHYDWLKSLPLYYESDKLWVSHAPIPSRAFQEKFGNSADQLPPSDPPPRDFRLSRKTLTWSYFGNDGDLAHDHGKLAVCGHVHAVREGIFQPRVFEKIIFADTGAGCWPDAPLSAIVIEDGKLVATLQSWPDKPEGTKDENQNIGVG